MLIESIAKSAKHVPRAAVTAAVVGVAGAAALAGPHAIDSHETSMMARRERGSVVPGAEPAGECSRLSVAAGRAVRNGLMPNPSTYGWGRQLIGVRVSRSVLQTSISSGEPRDGVIWLRKLGKAEATHESAAGMRKHGTHCDRERERRTQSGVGINPRVACHRGQNESLIYSIKQGGTCL